MFKTSVSGKVVPVSQWVLATGDDMWKCNHCGGGLHKWAPGDKDPQPIMCPDCNAIMVDKGAIGG